MTAILRYRYHLCIGLLFLLMIREGMTWNSKPKPQIHKKALRIRQKNLMNPILTGFSVLSFLSLTPSSLLSVIAEDNSVYSTTVQKVPLYSERNPNVLLYTDISRGFKLFRPFGFNEFNGAGTGYLVKFSSLFDVDENVVVGYSDASSEKKSITDYGSLEKIGEKLAAKRGGKVVNALIRETNGITYYQYEFENPVDTSLPRPKSMKPTKGIELYELCVARGKLWSVQATSNDKLFPLHEKTLRIALASFSPQL